MEAMYTVAVRLTSPMMRTPRKARVWKRAAAEVYADARKAGAELYKSPPLSHPQCVIDAWIAFYRAAPYRCVLQYDTVEGTVGSVAMLFDTEKDSKMPAYILRDIDPKLWIKVKTRAASEDKPLKQVMTEMLTRYAEGLKESK